MKFGNASFKNVILRTDTLPLGEKGSTWFAEMIGSSRSIEGRQIFLDMPIEVSRDINLSVTECILSALEGHIPFDLETAEAGAPPCDLGFRLPSV